MTKLRKALAFAALSFVAAAILPARVLASQEGAYLYHQFMLTGPAVIYGSSTSYTGSDGTARTGVQITTGTTAAMTGVFSLRFLGALGGKPATSTEGDFYYDTSLHSIVIATGTSTSTDKWVKALINSSSNGGWTAY